MNRFGFRLWLALAVGLLMPGLASGQTQVEPAIASGGVVVTAADGTAAERLRPAASTAALFAPAVSTRFDAATEPYRQVEIDDEDDDGIPYMIAGGIAFLAGAIVGDDVGTILMLGGAGVGAYGAFIYFGGD